MPDVAEPGLLCYLVSPPFHGPAFDLDAVAAVPAGQVVVMGVGLAPAVQDLAGRIPDRVDPAGLTEYLQVAVDRGEPNRFAPITQLGVDLLSAGEAREPVERGGDGFGLPGPGDPGAVHTASGGPLGHAHTWHGSSQADKLLTFAPSRRARRLDGEKM
jgi:hypothetical protein